MIHAVQLATRIVPSCSECSPKSIAIGGHLPFLKMTRWFFRRSSNHTRARVWNVSARGYLRQAAEIFSDGRVSTEGITHPELYIRARALHFYVFSLARTTGAIESLSAAEEPPPDVNAEITRSKLAGEPGFDDLDLVLQQQLMELTQRLVIALVEPTWLRTDAMMAHAKLFNASILDNGDPQGMELLKIDIQSFGEPYINYFCYILLDFATIDPDIDDAALAAMMQFAQCLELADAFGRLLAKELKMTKRAISRLAKDAELIVLKASTELKATV